MSLTMRDQVRRAAVVVCVGWLVTSGCKRRPATSAGREAAAARATPVSVVKVEPRPVFRAGIEVTGNVEAMEQVKLFSKVPGRLEALRARQGDTVKVYQVIAMIERRAVEAQVETSRAGIKVAEAGLSAAEAGFENATTNARRLRALFKKGSCTQQQLDGAETAYRSALAQRDLARAQISQLEAVLRQAQIQLDECTIRSPMNGVVVNDFDHTRGEMIAPQVPVLEIADMSKVRVAVQVSETELASVSEGQAALVKVARFPGREFKGKVWRVSPVVDRRSRTAKVEMLVENPESKGEYALKPGMFARATIVTAESRNALVVPERSVQHQAGKAFVFVANGGHARKVPVEVGLVSAGEAVVAKGLKGGELVIAEGAGGLDDGDRIETEGGTK